MKNLCYDEIMDMHSLRLTFATILRFLGYISCALGWLWLAVIGLPPLIESGALSVLLPDETASQPSASSEPQPGLSPVASLAVGLITLLMLLITFWILWRLPRTVVRGGDKIVETTAETVLPVVTHHKKLPQKRRRELGRRLAFVIQVFMTALPLIIVILLPIPATLSKEIVVVIGTSLAGAGLVSFTGAYLLSKQVGTTSRTRSHASRE